MILTKEQWQSSREPYNPGDYVETLDAQAQTIAELTAKLAVRGRIIDQQNTERIKINEENQRNYNAVTAKLDVVREFADEMDRHSDKHIQNPITTKQAAVEGVCANRLLLILDAPTKPKEARNGEE